MRRATPCQPDIAPEHLHSLVPQGSVSAILALKPELHLYDFLVTQMSFKNCIVNACEKLDLICSDRKTQQAEGLITKPFAKSCLSKCSSRMRRQAVIVDVALKVGPKSL